MDNPLSSLLANLFLDNLEDNYIFNNSNKFTKIKPWYGYLDDIKTFIEGTSQDFEQLLNDPIKKHSGTNFIVETDF